MQTRHSHKQVTTHAEIFPELKYRAIYRFAENCAEDEFELKTGTLYPLLAAMEDRGFLSSRTASLSGRERKFYRTTEQGKEYLLQQTERWYKWEAFTNKILER